MVAALNFRYLSPGRWLATALCAVVLAACGGAKQPLPPPEPPPRQATPVMSSERLAAESGDFAALAKQYTRASQSLTGNAKTAALLRAGEMQLALGNESAAREFLAELRGNSFQPVLQAQLFMRENLLDAAQRELSTLPSPIPSSLQPVTATAQATLLAKRGKLTEANEALSTARYTDGPLGGAVERIVNQFQRWNLLHSQRINPQWLNSGSDVDRGWLTLADIAQRGWQAPEQYSQRIRQWQQRYSSHPAQQRIAPALLAKTERISAPQKVALLLSNSTDSEAIALGSLAAKFANSSELRVFNATAATLNSQLQQILQWRADAIIGPDNELLGAAMSRFSARRGAPLVLTLAGSADNVTHFGLDAASEARSIANYANSKNQRRALLLAPAGARGDEFSTALEIRLAQLGGDLLAAERYAPGQSDFRALLIRLLEIDSSNTREQELSRLLGTELASPNRSRTDVDFLALDATPLQAKLIKQQLAELRINNLQIIATSRLSAGAAFELDGLPFAATPWQFSDRRSPEASTLAAQLPQQFNDKAAHYALGFDAYRLLPLLIAKQQTESDSNRVWQASLQQAWLNGGTGNLLVQNGSVQRELPIAMFRSGRIVAAQ